MTTVAQIQPEVSSNKINVSKAFGFKLDTGSEYEITPVQHPELIPKEDSDYVFARDESFFKLMNYFVGLKKRGIWIAGPTGSGKSSIVKQMCNRLMKPLVFISCGADTTFGDLFGQFTVKDGNTVFVDGPVTFAMKHGYAVLLDEVDLLDPDVATKMNGFAEADSEGVHSVLLDANGVCIVESAPGFRLFATANTNGTGDFTGNYGATKTQSLPLRNRFDYIEAVYPSAETEMRILANKVEGDNTLVSEKLVQVANMSRLAHNGTTPKAAAGVRIDLGMDQNGNIKGMTDTDSNKVNQLNGLLSSVLSTRQLIHVLAYYKMYAPIPGINPLRMAAEEVFIDGAPLDEREALEDIFSLCMGDLWDVKNPVMDGLLEGVR